MWAIGPAPPEKDMATVAAVGTTRPSAAKVRVGSVGTQSWPTRIRTADP